MTSTDASIRIGRRISALRDARHMTQADLAEALGVSRSTVTMWETGAHYPPIALLGPLARVLDCRIEDILANPPADEETSA